MKSHEPANHDDAPKVPPQQAPQQVPSGTEFLVREVVHGEKSRAWIDLSAKIVFYLRTRFGNSSFPPGTEGHGGRMPGVALRMMDPPGRRAEARPRIETLATFFGGQGSINVNSWAPDSQRFAYVVYELMP